MSNSTTVDADVEASVLAAVMVDPTAIDEVQPALAVTDFATPAFRHIYQAVTDCASVGKACDKVSVAARLDHMGVLGSQVPAGMLDQILDRGQPGSALPTHIEVVKDRSRRRRVYQAARTIAEAAGAPNITGAEALAVAEKTIFDLGDTDDRQNQSMSLTGAVAEFLQQARSRVPGELLGASTGFPALDDATQGFQPGQVIIVAARPGMGKTALASQFALALAKDTGAAVPFFSHEMTGTELSSRILSAHLGIALRDLQRGQFTAEQEDAIVRAQEELSDINIRVFDTPPSNISEYRSVLRREHRHNPIGAFVVDYIQMVGGQPGSKQSRTDELADIVYGFKDLCKELGVPGIILSQLNRGIEQRIDKRPKSSDLRDSGALEQAADLVMFLHRPHESDPGADPTLGEFHITKQRSGESPLYLRVLWNGRCTRYESDPRFPSATKPPAPGGNGGGVGGW